MTQTEHGPEAQWRKALQEGRFLLQQDRASKDYVFPPRVGDFDWVEASGRGVVYSVTTIPQRAPADSYSVVLVDLDEGPRLMSRVEGAAPEAVRIGMRVAARIAQGEDGPLLVFDPAQEA
jgi:uncharacterized OB-fold protein